MKISEALRDVTCVFLDTAPVIYYVERHPSYAARVDPVFEGLDNGTFLAVTSPVTLAECLILPLRLGEDKAQRDFTDLIVQGAGITFVLLDETVARRAAELRARYHFTLADAFQVAAAIYGGCNAFLTNDEDLKRVQEIRVLVLSEFEG